jgi:hypothetical protein
MKYTIRHIARAWSTDHELSEATLYEYLRHYCKRKGKAKPYKLGHREAKNAIDAKNSNWVWPAHNLQYVHCIKCGKCVRDGKRVLSKNPYCCDICYDEVVGPDDVGEIIEEYKRNNAV